MHGFAVMAIGLWRAEKPRAVLACWDTLTVPTYRHEEWPEYQSGREFDPEIVEQLDRMPELCEALGFAWAKGPGYEADDLLATAARLEAEAGGRALVVTSDRDAYQLVSDAVTVLSPRTGGYAPDRVDRAEVVSRYGVLPEQVPDFIALRGDPSDKIPGAKGIGAKGAAEPARAVRVARGDRGRRRRADAAAARGGAGRAAGALPARRDDGSEGAGEAARRQHGRYERAAAYARPRSAMSGWLRGSKERG